jgi:hypothetical protein
MGIFKVDASSSTPADLAALAGFLRRRIIAMKVKDPRPSYSGVLFYIEPLKTSVIISPSD